MKKGYYYKERLYYAYLLTELRSSSIITDADVAEAILKNQIIDNYFNRNIGEDEKADSEVEKAVAIAVAQIAIKKEYDEAQVVEIARESVRVLRDARLKKLLEEKKISEEEYERSQQATLFSTFIAFVKVLCAKYMDKAFEWILAKATMLIPIPVVQVFARVWAVIPSPVKNVIKVAAKKLVNKVIEKIPEIAKYLCEKGCEIAKKSIEIIKTGCEQFAKLGKEVLRGLGSMARNTAIVIEKTANAVGIVLAAPFRTFAKLFS